MGAGCRLLPSPVDISWSTPVTGHAGAFCRDRVPAVAGRLSGAVRTFVCCGARLLADNHLAVQTQVDKVSSCHRWPGNSARMPLHLVRAAISSDFAQFW